MCWLRKSPPDSGFEHEGKLNRCTPFTQPQRRVIRRALFAGLTVTAMFVFFGVWLWYGVLLGFWHGLWRAILSEILFLLSLLILFSLLEVPQFIAVCIWGRPAPHFLWMEGGEYVMPKSAQLPPGTRVQLVTTAPPSFRGPSWD